MASATRFRDRDDEFFGVDKTVSSSCGVKGVSVTACSHFARYIECVVWLLFF